MQGREPILLDLEQALTRADLLLESALGGLKKKPWLLMALPLWWLRGKALLRNKLAEFAHIDPRTLPYRPEALSLIEYARSAGRPIWLIASSHRRHAMAVSEHLGPFDRVVASDERMDLSGTAKTQQVQELLGSGNLEYVDGAKFQRSDSSVGVRVRTWLKAIRIHQWAKNALIFVPVVTAHAVLDLDILAAAFLAFLSMGLCASATYLINDLLDLESDRQHLRKRLRPFASGALSAKSGLVAASLLLLAGLLTATMLPPLFLLALGVYIVATLLYSFWFKRIASLDVITLAGLYTLRVIAGGWATGLKLSFWLLAFSLFLFLCLALAKRVAELVNHGRAPGSGKPGTTMLRGREYSLDDIPMLQIMGATSGYISVMVLALYINSPEVAHMYRSPQLLWLIAPAMLLWITRLWIVTSRGYMDEDPISFAIRDPETWATAAFTAVALVLATGI